MKAPAATTTMVFLVLSGATLVFLALELTIWSSPGVVISYAGPEAIVDSTFLGAYHLGVERIRIVSKQPDETVVDVRDPNARLPNVFRLRAGANEIGIPGGDGVGFRLVPERDYTLMLCGDNGWGRVTCRSRMLRLKAAGTARKPS